MATSRRADTLYHTRIGSAIAPMHAEPRVASTMISQLLAGRLVDVVAESGEWLRVRGADDYEGWMHHGFVRRLTNVASMRESEDGFRVSLGCTIRDVAGMTAALPLRALLAPGEEVVSGAAIDSAQLRARFPLNGTAIVESAQALFQGASYLWGGVTPWGADCSGMVQAVYGLHGLQLARDAWTQAVSGARLPLDFSAAVAGDLLFFSERDDRHITHVGIATGPDGMVHQSLARGGFARETFSMGDEYHDRLRARFVAARRFAL